ncbi:MAG: SpoIIE family protein phosphatase [Candidatus Riflebacteria bacterium]|nr:SpoIIE family protein phosphatase [Candidatus Riflebacteria bacterium]
MLPGWFDGFAKKSQAATKLSTISSLGKGWIFLLFIWIISFYTLSVSIMATSFYFQIALVVQAIAFFLLVQKLLKFKYEISFLREFQHLSQTLDELRKLHSKNAFEEILKAVVQIIGFDRAILFRLESDASVLTAVHSYNLAPEIQKQLVIPRNSGPSIAWRVVEEGLPVLVNSPSQHPEVNPRFMEMLQSSALALAPITRDGLSWGLLVVDRHLRRLPITDEDLLQLQVLADQISITLQNYALNEELSKRAEQLELQSARINQELAIAKVVQEGVLPRSKPDFVGIRTAAFMRPARIIGGDFFDFLDICKERKAGCPEKQCLVCEDRIQGVLIGDVCGKGIPGAMVMAMVKSLFHEKILLFSDPAELLTQVNISLKSYLGAETRFFSSAFIGFFDKSRSIFRYANAGHDFPLFLSSLTKEILPLPSTGTLLGIFKESTFTNNEIQISKGDRIFLYTDGIVDYFEHYKNEIDGLDYLKRFMLENFSKPVEENVEILKRETTSKLNEGEDDITAMMVSID